MRPFSQLCLGGQMGESRRRHQELVSNLAKAQAAAEVVGPAMKKLALAASSNVGSDCLMHAELSRLALADLGLEAVLVVGSAAWRLGHGEGDVVAHNYKVKGYLPPGATRGFAYHAWLRFGDVLLDFTTYQLSRKAAELDAGDQGHTTVEWCPDMLVVPMSAVSTFDQVAAATGPGVFYYEHVPQMQTRVTVGLQHDSADLAALKLIMANPSVIVRGPNQLHSG